MTIYLALSTALRELRELRSAPLMTIFMTVCNSVLGAFSSALAGRNIWSFCAEGRDFGLQEVEAVPI